MAWIDTLFSAFSNFVWGYLVLWLLLGGGIWLLIYSRGLAYRHFHHSFQLLTGRWDRHDDPGDITHFQALSAALSGTLGLGNIAGVAVAIFVGGPGAIFWMWLTGLLGVTLKFFTCSLAIMYRGRDSMGVLQGGPMYVIREGLPKRWYPLAVFFAVAAMFGTLPVFQVNQLTQIVRDVIAIPQGWAAADAHFGFDLGFGVLVALIVGVVIFGGISRVGYTAARIVPFMVLVYLAASIWILILNAGAIPAAFALIFTDAFTGQAVAGGFLGALLIGVRQGAFSNEAGIGNESLAHGAARTQVPVREGLVAMIGPVVDTLIVCTATALVILVTGVWETGTESGVTMTSQAFESVLGPFGPWLLVLLVVFFSVSTMFTFWYYGAKCLGFLIGAQKQHYYRWFYVLLVVIGSVLSIDAVVGLITGMYGLMAIPTIVSTVLLAPKVLAHARDYLGRSEAGRARWQAEVDPGS
ncbi:MAG: alanine:cation symporter family protein [Gammaproteobacteria bacterium]|nr:MAG: alanine:cation symporter family protein [Gammaproteobacteria bacterium]